MTDDLMRTEAAIKTWHSREEDPLLSPSEIIERLVRMGYKWHGGEYWKPPLGPKPDSLDGAGANLPEQYKWTMALSVCNTLKIETTELTPSEVYGLIEKNGWSWSGFVWIKNSINGNALSIGKDKNHYILKTMKPKWTTKVGDFSISHFKLNIWQRMWLRFIGWKVTRND